MSDEPQYYSRAQLAERAGMTARTFTRHEASNIGNLQAAREKHSGLGLVYKASLCRKYLALVAAGAKRQHPRKKPEPAQP